MTRITNFASLDRASTARRGRSIWSRIVDRLTAEQAQPVEHEIEQYLERHRYDLSPEVRIELERHFGGRHRD